MLVSNFFDGCFFRVIQVLAENALFSTFHSSIENREVIWIEERLFVLFNLIFGG